MALSLWDKARVGVLAQLNKYLDKSINNIDGYKQFIRELEQAMADLRAARDETVGTITGYERKITELQTGISESKADILLLLGDTDPGNDGSAVTLQERVQDDEDQITNLQALKTTVEGNKAKLDVALEKLDAKHTDMMNQLQRLAATQSMANAQQRASSAVDAALSASSAVGSVSVDNIQSNIEHKGDVAQARFDSTFEQLEGSDSAERDVKRARAQAAIDALRAQIAPKTPAEAPAST
jgi:phage shock protein A